MRRLFIFVLLLLSILFISCKNQNPSYIVVSGNAQINIPIDFMYVSVSIKENGPTAEAVREKSIPKVKDALRILTELGIPDSAITTTEYSIFKNGRYGWFEDMPKGQEYYFTYSLMAILPDISKYENMQIKLSKIGISNIDIADFGTTNLKKYNELLYENALVDAKNKAKFLIEKNGQKLGSVYKLLGFGNDIPNRFEDIDQTIDFFINEDVSPSVPIDCEDEDLMVDQLLKRKIFSKSLKITVAYFVE